MPEYSFYCENCSHKWVIVCPISEYSPNKACPSCRKRKTVFRDFGEDQIHGSVKAALSEVKTLGHYADLQAKKLGKWKCEDMMADFKTKKEEQKADLPDGMSRMERPTDAPQWTKDEPVKKRRKVKKRKKK